MVIAAACALFAAAAAPPPTTEPIDPAVVAEVKAVLRRLTSDSFAARERASAEVDALPGDAVPLIEDALAEGLLSPEVAIRLEMRLGALRRKAKITAYERRWRRAFEWDRASALAAYDRAGSRDPRWDAAAREAIAMTVRPRHDPNRLPSADARALAALAAARAAGCDDPYVQGLFAARSLAAPDADRPAMAALLADAAARIAAGAYPPYRKLIVTYRAAQAQWFEGAAEPSRGTRREMTALLDAATALLPAAAKAEDAFPPAIAVDAAALLLDEYVRLAGDDEAARRAALEKVAGALAAAGATPAALGTFEGRFYLAWARRARELHGIALRNRHPHRAAEQHEAAATAHLARAEAALRRAADADPTEPDAAVLLIRHAALAGRGVDEMLAWYARAVDAHPGSLAAAQARMAYLHDRGTHDDAAAFARECLDGNDWSSRTPLVAVDYHLWRASYFGKEPDGTYLARTDVWPVVSAAFEGYLKRYPGAVRDRTAYARVASLAGRWDVADREFRALEAAGGGGAAYDVFRGRATYDYYRRKAERLGRPPATVPPAP